MPCRRSSPAPARSDSVGGRAPLTTRTTNACRPPFSKNCSTAYATVDGCHNPPKCCWNSAKLAIGSARLTGPLSVRPTNAVIAVGARTMAPAVPPKAARTCGGADSTAALVTIGALFARPLLAFTARALGFFLFAGDLREHQLQPFGKLSHVGSSTYPSSRAVGGMPARAAVPPADPGRKAFRGSSPHRAADPIFRPRLHPQARGSAPGAHLRAPLPGSHPRATRPRGCRADRARGP